MSSNKKKSPRKMPLLSKALLMALAKNDKRYQWDPVDLDILYSMSADEYGFNKNMVDQKAVKTALYSFASGEKDNNLLMKVGSELLDVYYNENRDTKELKKLLFEMNNRYGIYKNGGMRAISAMVDSGFVSSSKMRDLYFNKYQKKYSRGK